MTECKTHRCAGRAAQLDNIDKFVARGLWGIVGLFESSPMVAYTVGLHSKGRTELIMSSEFTHQTQESCLNAMGATLGRHELTNFVAGQSYDDIMNMCTVFIDVSEIYKREICGTAYNYYGHWDFKVQQGVWPDREGKFPWDKGSAFEKGGEFYGKQRLFGKYKA